MVSTTSWLPHLGQKTFFIVIIFNDPANLYTIFPLSNIFFFEPALIHPAEGVVFGIHPLSGDALVLGFEFSVSLLVGGKELPELKDAGGQLDYSLPNSVTSFQDICKI